MSPLNEGEKDTATESVRLAPLVVTVDAARLTEHWLFWRVPVEPGAPESTQVGAVSSPR
ncbi:MAG: hypothetical protein ABJF23_15520 [Bryobacteraceae bacterium]